MKWGVGTDIGQFSIQAKILITFLKNEQSY